MPTDPELKISLSQWNEKLKIIAELREDVQRLKTLKAADPRDVSAKLRAALDAALPIVQFAVGEMDPATVRRWPWPKLQEFGELLKEVAADDQALIEAGDAFIIFARDCREMDNFRAKRHNAARSIVGMTQAGDDEGDPTVDTVEEIPPHDA